MPVNAADPTSPDDSVPPPAGGADSPESVAALCAGMTGRWLVRTRSSEHIFDLDAGTYCRVPGDTAKQFAYDGQAQRITRVVQWPAVGHRSFIWYDDPECPDALEQYRISSTIRSITRLAPL